eukprot:PhF_6_TR38873/c0_g1_i1/m.58136
MTSAGTIRVSTAEVVLPTSIQLAYLAECGRNVKYDSSSRHLHLQFRIPKATVIFKSDHKFTIMGAKTPEIVERTSEKMWHLLGNVFPSEKENFGEFNKDCIRYTGFVYESHAQAFRPAQMLTIQNMAKDTIQIQLLKKLTASEVRAVRGLFAGVDFKCSSDASSEQQERLSDVAYVTYSVRYVDATLVSLNDREHVTIDVLGPGKDYPTGLCKASGKIYQHGRIQIAAGSMETLNLLREKIDGIVRAMSSQN